MIAADISPQAKRVNTAYLIVAAINFAAMAVHFIAAKKAGELFILAGCLIGLSGCGFLWSAFSNNPAQEKRV